MSTFNMRNLSLLLIFSMTCLCWTRPSHALSVRQKLVELGTSVDQIRDTMNATSRDLHEKLIKITEKMDRINGALDDVITATGCQTNFILFESSCYYFGERLPIHSGDQSYARAVCQMKGSDLVAIESKKEEDFLRNHNTSGHHYWTSAHKHGAIWMWDSTGDIIAFYSPWHTGEPNTAINFCAYLNYAVWKLVDASCSEAGRSYICETKLPACA